MTDRILLTFGTMGPKAGANPFRHSYFLLSRWIEGANSMQVFAAWGFTAVPSRGNPNSVLTYIKKDWLRFNYDMYGNHGILCQEHTRFLDVGDGLHGVSFEITQANSERLLANCQAMVREQEAAIAQAVRDLKLSPKQNKDIKVYAYEDHAQQIYNHELQLARTESRPARLKQFAFPLFSFKTNTCKTQLVHLFEDILTPQQIASLTNHGLTTSYPIFSGPTESIHLYTKGALSSHTKASGEVVHYRDNYVDKIDLEWTVAPTLIETLNPQTKNQLQIDPAYVKDFKRYAKTLQALYWFFVHLPKPHAELIQNIEAKISGLFELSITTKSPQNHQPTGCMSGFFRSSKVSANTRPQALAELEDFFNNLYESSESLAEAEEDKVKLCKILGRRYDPKPSPKPL